jgi:hypothetical protein
VDGIGAVIWQGVVDGHIGAGMIAYCYSLAADVSNIDFVAHDFSWNWLAG